MSTQFAQPALVVMEMAEYAHLQAQGVVKRSALFAGHSLGEYSALGACSTFMPFESLLSLIFYRGLKMQNALPRDSNGRTEYAMMAIDPSRIGSGIHSTFQLIGLQLTLQTLTNASLWNWLGLLQGKRASYWRLSTTTSNRDSTYVLVM